MLQDKKLVQAINAWIPLINKGREELSEQLAQFHRLLENVNMSLDDRLKIISAIKDIVTCAVKTVESNAKTPTEVPESDESLIETLQGGKG